MSCGRGLDECSCPSFAEACAVKRKGQPRRKVATACALLPERIMRHLTDTYRQQMVKESLKDTDGRDAHERDIKILHAAVNRLIQIIERAEGKVKHFPLLLTQENKVRLTDLPVAKNILERYVHHARMQLGEGDLARENGYAHKKLKKGRRGRNPARTVAFFMAHHCDIEGIEFVSTKTKTAVRSLVGIARAAGDTLDVETARNIIRDTKRNFSSG